MRKKAAALLTALLEAPLSPHAAARLSEAVLPVLVQLLGVRRDSGVHPGDEGAQVGVCVSVCVYVCVRGGECGTVRKGQSQLEGEVVALGYSRVRGERKRHMSTDSQFLHCNHQAATHNSAAANPSPPLLCMNLLCRL